MQPPTDWPSVTRENYEPIRILGKGGFASVVLARQKANSQKGKQEQTHTGGYVAIKVEGNANVGVTKQQQLYGHREIDILRAISHPNIVKCLDYVEPLPGASMIIVLSYSPGPTVHALLKKGGALSTIFGRVVIAQLVDALTYLQYHAVVHRDIKPDNIIVTGAHTSQSEIWDNPEDFDNDVDHQSPTPTPPDWASLLKKWHVTLIDFGFARALTKDDVHQEQPSSNSISMSDDDERGGERQYSQQSLDTTTTGGSQWSEQSLNRSLRSSLRVSCCDGKQQQQQRMTSKLHRQMSALGSPLFAAPEIKNKVYKVSQSDALSDSSNVDDITRTISTFVADYGLLVDAYSLGCTIRYMMTGCVPHQSVAQAIANQSTVVDVLCRMMGCGHSTRRRNKKPERTVRYRLVSDLPKEVQRLIEKSTLVDQTQRASVRAVRRYNWINDVLSTTDDNGPPEVFDMADIQYLDFTDTPEEHAKHVPTACVDH